MNKLIVPLVWLVILAGAGDCCSGTAFADPPPIPGLSLSGDFTITYRVTQKDVSPPQVRQQRQSYVYSLLLQQDYQDATHQQLKPSDPGPPTLQEEARAQSKRASDFSCGPLTLTLAQRQGSFLYRLADDQAGRLNGDAIPAMPPRLVLFDGNKSLEHDTAQAHSAFLVYNGLDSNDMDRMPVFCAGTPAFPFFKDLTYNALLNCYQGSVLDPGNGVNRLVIYYDQDTSVYVDRAKNKPRIKTIIRTGPDGQVRQRMDVTDYRLLRGTWIPAKAAMTIYNLNGVRQRMPFLIVTWSLVSASPNADKALFDPNHYLKKGDIIQEAGNPRTGPGD